LIRSRYVTTIKDKVYVTSVEVSFVLRTKVLAASNDR